MGQVIFNGSRMRDLREAFNLSRKELAVKTEINEKLIARYECNVRSPGRNNIQKISYVFGVLPSFFKNAKLIPRTVQAGNVSYNSAISRSTKATRYETAYLNVVDDFISRLLLDVTIPNSAIEDLVIYCVAMKEAGTSIEEIAHHIRGILGMDDRNTQFMAALERVGVFVVERGLNNEVSSYSCWTEEGRPYVVLGNNMPVDYHLFNLAHEFGHLLLHRTQEFDLLDGVESLRTEKEADEFACALLLDRDNFLERFRAEQSHENQLNVDTVLGLKRFYNVPVNVILKRAVSLGIYTLEQTSQIRKQLSNRQNGQPGLQQQKEILYVPGKLSAMLAVLTPYQVNKLSMEYGIMCGFIQSLIVREVPDNIGQIGKERNMYLYR